MAERPRSVWKTWVAPSVYSVRPTSGDMMQKGITRWRPNHELRITNRGREAPSRRRSGLLAQGFQGFFRGPADGVARIAPELFDVLEAVRRAQVAEGPERPPAHVRVRILEQRGEVRGRLLRAQAAQR